MMGFERLHFRKKTLFFMVFLHFALCSYADLILDDFNLNVIERFENDLFLTKKSHKLVTQNDEECLAELNKIGSGLMNSKMWATKIVDAWGRMPSAFLDGNWYELGSFAECLNIEWNDQLYETKYCLGALPLDTERNGSKVLQTYINLNVGLFPNIWLPNDRPDVPAEFKFGMCVPAVCSMDLLQKFINSTDKIELSESTCQTLKTGSELTNLDLAVIIILAIVFILALLSTAYDGYCSRYNYEKSQVLMAFSIITNGKKILSSKESKSPDTINCLHGIRAISTEWIVVAHTYAIYSMVPNRNMVAQSMFFSKYPSLLILCASLAVETFFVISGLLVSINMLKRLRRTNGSINIISMYLHRYLRLTPLLVATVLFSMTLMRFLNDGPLWPMFMNSIKGQCETYWWSTFLYVQNYVNPYDLCINPTWYLSADMQLFLVAPFVIYLIYWFELKAMFFLVLSILGSIGFTVFVNVHNEFKGLMSPNKFQVTYLPTHMRFSSWLVGVIFGYIFLKYQNRSICIPRMLNLFSWTLSIAVMLTVMFLNYPLSQLNSKASSFEYGLYDGLSRVCWSIALCYIIFACVHNAGGPVNWFLSLPLWQSISRLSYATYLVHYLVIIVVLIPSKTSLYFDDFTIFIIFVAIYDLSLCVAFIATLLFESPIIILAKLFSSSKKKTNPEYAVVSSKTYKNPIEIK